MVIIIYQAKIGVCPGLGKKNDILGNCGVTSAGCAMRLRFKRACLPCISIGRASGGKRGGRGHWQQILPKSSSECTIFVTHPPAVGLHSLFFRELHYLATMVLRRESGATAARVSTCCCDNASSCELHRHTSTWMYALEFQLFTSS